MEEESDEQDILHFTFLVSSKIHNNKFQNWIKHQLKAGRSYRVKE